MSKTSLIIFDFDGTLCDSFELFVRIVDQLAPIYGFRSSSEVEMEKMRALPADQVMRALGISYWKLPFILFHARWLFKKQHSQTNIFEEMMDTIDRLRPHYRIGIMTTNAKKNLKLLLGDRLSWFEFVEDRVGLFSKPRRLRQILKKYGLQDRAAEALYVGDEARDIIAAKRSGVRPAAVTWGYNARPLLEKLEPDMIIDRAESLEELFA